MLLSPWLSFVLLQFKNKAGGSTIYVSDVIKCKQMSIKINTDECEDVSLQPSLYQNKSLILGLVCRHSDYNIKPIEDAFVKVIKKMNVYQNYNTMRDFHINYDNSTMLQNIIDYANHISSIGCAQLFNKPTRVCKTSSK